MLDRAVERRTVGSSPASLALQDDPIEGFSNVFTASKLIGIELVAWRSVLSG